MSDQVITVRCAIFFWRREFAGGCTRRVGITAAGKEFVAVAERMLNDLQISVRSMREIGEEQRGQITISSIMSVANGLLPAVVAKYQASRPGIEIILREGVHGTVFEDRRSGTADLGITANVSRARVIPARPFRARRGCEYLSVRNSNI